MRWVCTLFAVLLIEGGGSSDALAQSSPPPLTEDQAREIAAHVQAMQADPRGPYVRIRWFCNDGTVHPPQAGACSARGGGVQHAEFNDRAKRLRALGVHVGTILQALTFEEFLDSAVAHAWPRELVVNRFLEEIDNGWVLRQARYYRGARQIEDEERQGQAFLERLLSTPNWAADNFLLATALVEAVPHVGLSDQQRVDRIRNLATEVADLDSAFFRIRIKIHSFPTRADLDAVETYLTSRRHSDVVHGKLTQLRDELRVQYDPGRKAEAIQRYRRLLRGQFAPDLDSVSRQYDRGDPAGALGAIAALSPKLRRRVAESADGKTNLLLMDLNLVLQEHAFVLAQEGEGRTGRISRRERLRLISQYLALAHGAGFLTQRELNALREEIQRLESAQRLTALRYKNGLGYLGRSLDWSTATVRGVFGPIQQRYVQFEPKAAGFVDAVLRGSVLLPLSRELDRGGADADAVLGASHVIMGQRVSQGVRGLNPGIAVRTLEVLQSEHADDVQADKVYLVPQTTAELRPVAGVLTLDEGNLLSHVQLLARNLGIPNAALTPSLIPLVQRAQGQQVFYAVSPLGRVVLKQASDMTPADRTLATDARDAKRDKIRLDTSRLRLDRAAPIPLTELRLEHSGVVVGPKAANLGQLGANFPGRVSAGVALPFGMFYRHANRPFGSDKTVLEELREAYERVDVMRAAGSSETAIDEYMFGVLARVRTAIVELDWLPDVRQAVVDAVRVTFGDRLDRGVFVRSDTNVEDLPQFSGAGLNLTVPHLRTLEDVLRSVKRVWTSPFSERAYLWRKQILEEQGMIFPSVLLLASVHSEKSGVMITTGLQYGGADDLTIVTAEGVGGGVEGEDAETIVVDGAGSVRLLSQAKAPQRRVLVERGAGGVTWVVSRMPEYLLTADELDQLRNVARDWTQRFAGTDDRTVWDVEFGFVEGKLWLFQIRPFVRFRSSDLLERLSVLDRDVLRQSGRPISLEQRL